MKKLNLIDFHNARKLLSQIEHETVLKTIISGETPGVIYVDKKDNPKIVFAQFKQRTFLSGEPSVDFVNLLKKFFETEVSKHCREFDVPFFRLTMNNPQWLDIVCTALEPREPIITGYRCYQKLLNGEDQNFSIPDGFDITSVTQDLINSSFSGREELLEEMCSERESVEAFLEKSFGIAAFKDDALAGWCLSEYNHRDQCEVGIATMAPYRRIGLAKSMTHVFLNKANRNGIKRVLWHCFESNHPSWRTALSADFSLADSHDVLMLYWEPSLNDAVHGNILFEQEKYEQALVWYEKALDKREPQSWMAFNAACAAAHLNQPELAFMHLNQMVDLGFNNLDYLVANKHLAPLKNDPKWGELITQLNIKLQSEL